MEPSLDQDLRHDGGVEHQAHGEVRSFLRRVNDVAGHGQLGRDEQIVESVIAIPLLAQEHLLTSLGDDAEGRLGDTVARPGW